MKRIIFRTTLLAACIPALSGCVAALVPVVASGALMGNSQLKSGDKDDRDGVVTVEETAAEEVATAPAPAVPEPAAEDIVEVQVVEVAVEELPASAIAIPGTQDAQSEPSSPAFIGPVDDQQEAVQLAATADDTIAELPAAASPVEAPQPAAKPAELAIAPATEPREITAPTTPAGPTDFRAYDALYGYVESQARRDPVQSPRQSAVLAAPGSLSPQRIDCSIRPPAVVIDLDPGEQAFDANIAPRPNPSLGQILTSLRLQEIDIFWISRQSAVSAGAVRRALVASGLDPQGQDSLLLMRSAGDRKQARRKELAETHCLLAIGGDTRADFDELYLYLKDQSAAQSLEELIGAGWFLTPLPLTEGQ